MHRGWHIFRALRSDSREWPRRIGVSGAGVAVDVDVENGLGAGGESKRRRCVCT